MLTSNAKNGPRRLLLLLSSVACLALAVACDKQDGGDESSGTSSSATANAAQLPSDDQPAGEPEAEAPSGEGGTTAQAGQGEAGDGAEPIGTGRYPGVNFVLLEQDERRQFVDLAEAEVCPCEGAASSLDACLQDPGTSCALAQQVASLMMRMIKEEADEIEISAAVQETVRTARQVNEFTLDGRPAKGTEEPEVVLVEFADFECPHCRELSRVVDVLAGEFGDRVRFYFKQFPLAAHRNAFAASIASLAAHRQGQFWAFHDLLFENQSRLHTTDDPAALFARWAEELGLNRDRFLADMEDSALRQMVEQDRREGIQAGVDATPTVYIDGVKVLDGYSEQALRARLQQALAEEE